MLSSLCTMKLLSLVLLIIHFVFAVESSAAAGEVEVELRPIAAIEYRAIEDAKTITSVRGRQLAPYELCLLCKCCAANNNTTCVTVPCCFGIDCQLPNKPFGVCAFVPKACNCTSCAP